jgi:hypothetical protein
MSTKQLFSLSLSREEEDGFGEFRSFQIDPNLIKETEKTYTIVEKTIEIALKIIPFTI